jgi:hypothetical protein
MQFHADLRRMGLSEAQAATVMRTVPTDRREIFLRNFEGLLSVPVNFNVAVRAALWSVQQDDEAA